MPRYVAFLRGINIGKRRLPMSQLMQAFEALGFDQVATFISSGNVIFSSRKSPTTIEDITEKYLEETLGYPVDTFVRDARRVIEIGDSTPFKDEAPAAASNDFNHAKNGTLHVGFFKSPLPCELAARMSKIQTDVDKFTVTGSEYFWHCQVGVSESKVWTLPEVRALELPTSSMRNMTSIRKLIAKHLV